MIGPGKAFDTDKYFVICSNVIGGCRGSTGPSSINPEDGQALRPRFPARHRRGHGERPAPPRRPPRHRPAPLRRRRLHGGMQALQWVASYPERVRSVIPIATTATHSPQQIAFNEVGRQAIMADPNWNDGNYYGGELPAKGLSVARMVGHITYMSDVSMGEKFGRRFKNGQSRLQVRPGLRGGGLSPVQGRELHQALRPQLLPLHHEGDRLLRPRERQGAPGGTSGLKPRGSSSSPSSPTGSTRRTSPRRSPGRASGRGSRRPTPSSIPLGPRRIPHRSGRAGPPDQAFPQEGNGIGISYGTTKPGRSDSTRNAILEIVTPGATVLDLGCGDGELLAALVGREAREGPGHRDRRRGHTRDA